jgi:hypothetical protein
MGPVCQGDCEGKVYMGSLMISGAHLRWSVAWLIGLFISWMMLE